MFGINGFAFYLSNGIYAELKHSLPVSISFGARRDKMTDFARVSHSQLTLIVNPVYVLCRGCIDVSSINIYGFRWEFKRKMVSPKWNRNAFNIQSEDPSGDGDIEFIAGAISRGRR